MRSRRARCSSTSSTRTPRSACSSTTPGRPRSCTATRRRSPHPPRSTTPCFSPPSPPPRPWREPQPAAPVRRLEAIGDSDRQQQAGSLGLRWVEIGWLEVRTERIGALTVGARRDQRLSEDDLALFDVAAVQLSDRLEGIERSPAFLRSRALELA